MNINSKFKLSVTFLMLFFITSTHAENLRDAPITQEPLSCRATAMISPAYGRTVIEDHHGYRYVNQYDYRFDKTKEKVEEILESKGYSFDHTCGENLPEGTVASYCFGSTNYYLTIQIGYDHKRFFLRGVWPDSFDVSVHRYSRLDGVDEFGYYYKVPSYQVARFQPNSYYDDLILYEASKVPDCEDLRLQGISRF